MTDANTNLTASSTLVDPIYYNGTTDPETLYKYQPANKCLYLSQHVVFFHGFCEEMNNLPIHSSVAEQLFQVPAGSINSLSDFLGSFVFFDDPNPASSSYKQSAWNNATNGVMYQVLQSICPIQKHPYTYDSVLFASNVRYFREAMCRYMVRATHNSGLCTLPPDPSGDPYVNCAKTTAAFFYTSLTYSINTMAPQCGASDITSLNNNSLTQIATNMSDPGLFAIGFDNCTGSQYSTYWASGQVYPDTCGFINYYAPNSAGTGSVIFNYKNKYSGDLNKAEDLCSGKININERSSCCDAISAWNQAIQNTYAKGNSTQNTEIVSAIIVPSAVAVVVLALLAIALYVGYNAFWRRIEQVNSQKQQLEIELYNVTSQPVSAPTFKRKWIVEKPYLARRGDEVDLRVGDVVTLLSVFNDGWGHAHNETTDSIGTIPMSALGPIGRSQTPSFKGEIEEQSLMF
ncbi:uncharacterized protein BJ171DRAFT_199201 [Polychytrium aggregatum]|uniref:uncharacterized protein n=1 Tax=Polychytrium aggregatum TaxID=110093 RepID=UPI0022FF4034|nr:uncharacterized protein BJ171DRAFT_199201 [Polychytrium aggregatum]KAI9199850.1 hypothetical protein BJ171DRAFT_199201 [Polychytrium aggregatum]